MLLFCLRQIFLSERRLRFTVCGLTSAKKEENFTNNKTTKTFIMHRKVLTNHRRLAGRRKNKQINNANLISLIRINRQIGGTILFNKHLECGGKAAAFPNAFEFSEKRKLPFCRSTPKFE